jgi:integrase
MKKIRGKILYFGHWAKRVNGQLVRVEGDGWEEALRIYKAQADDLHAGRTPRVQTDAVTVRYLCNHFLTAKTRKQEAGELSARMFAEYRQTTDRLVATFGKDRLVSDLASDDFASLRADLAKQYGPVRLGNEIQKVRTIFKHGIDNGVIDKAVRYGSEFKKPDKRVMRTHRAKQGPKTFTAQEIRKLIDAAGQPLKTMILLGINCAYGNGDCGTLPLSALDLESGWADFPRPKTGIPRRCPLWPETIQAIKEWLAERPQPKTEEHADLVFITKHGLAWGKEIIDNPVSKQTRKLLDSLGMNGHRNFYSLRHTFRTVAHAMKDANAIRCIMGHTDDSIDANYTHGIGDSRLRAVAEHVRQWLFGNAPDDAKTETETSASSAAIDLPERDDGGNERPRLRLFAG